jgi:hypothetical protein
MTPAAAACSRLTCRNDQSVQKKISNDRSINPSIKASIDRSINGGGGGMNIRKDPTIINS